MLFTAVTPLCTLGYKMSSRPTGLQCETWSQNSCALYFKFLVHFTYTNSFFLMEVNFLTVIDKNKYK